MSGILIRCLVLCLLAACSTIAQPPDGSQAWAHFFAWWSKQPVDVKSNIEVFLVPYGEQLKREGLSADEAAARVKFIEDEVFRRADFSAALYDVRYTAKETVFNQAPNAFVARIAAGLKPGFALDVQMGQGRNAVYLARNGWTVTGFDIAAEGVRAAKDAALRGSGHLEAVRSDHRDFDYGVNKWDLIVLSYPWIPFSDRATYEKIIRSLKPGGSLVYEHFIDEEGAAHTNEVLRAFSGLHVVFYEETVDKADWEKQRQARLVRLHAKKD
jgi:2-polyprenyl-3-methyl-5-hydroxy-6-metoxy-1,4-benzoquinol methylase